ncbi:oxidoreductase [Acinetobacter sp. TGL-Y2]|uniref:flavin reductase family protein n=1 Tax=Acinetobacter sp. TGL-Y2 TaxID=1407071 RepID=UPI0007A6725C|nr:iron-sulfur cluster-binding domain-containing protein [Acinetobacter sp. TGL-Y2]AMW78399.1 oxidoreductase [Acinetobacter sp. TGL-Y2]
MHAVMQRKSVFGSIVESVFDAQAANFWLKKINPIWSVNESLGRIVEKSETASETVSLKIQINKKFNMGQAGQHHPVIVTRNGRRYERTYSLTQLDDAHVLLTAKKVHKGMASTWLCELSKIGDVIEFGLPYGDMLIDKNHAPLVLLAAGSGITPMYSLLKTLVKTKQIENKPVQLMYWVKKHSDAAFKTELEQWAIQYPNFKLHIFYTQEQEMDARLNPEHVQCIENLNTTTVYSCGPSGFVAVAEQMFAQAKVFKSEAFSLTPVINNETGFITVTLSKLNQSVSIPKGQSILLGLEQQNIKPTHGCRMGVCNKCACVKAQGSTKNLVNGAEHTEPGGLLKICVNSAQTDLVIDL